MLSMFPVMTLMMADASRVIELRLRMIALGKSPPDELLLMVTEKIGAMNYANSIMMCGGSLSLVIDNYQKIVRANVARLSSANN